MLKMVEDESFEQISVRNLAKTADVSHPTFYRNYSSKEDILAEIAAEELQNLWKRMLSLRDLRNPYETACEICCHVQTHKQLWKTLVTTSASSVLRDEYVRLSASLAKKRPPINEDLPTPMVAAFIAAGMIEILAWWLKQPEDYPVDNVAQFLARLILNPTIGPDVFYLNKA